MREVCPALEGCGVTADDLRVAGLLPALAPGPGGKLTGSLYALCSAVLARLQSYSSSMGLAQCSHASGLGSLAWLSVSLGPAPACMLTNACSGLPGVPLQQTAFAWQGLTWLCYRLALQRVGCPAPSPVTACSVVDGFNSCSLQRLENLARVPRPSPLHAAGYVLPLLHRSLQPLPHSRHQAQPRQRVRRRPPPSVWPMCWLRRLFRSC